MVESNPWWKNLPTDRGELPDSYGCVGVKPDGGGCMAGRGRVGPMRLHRACYNRDLAALQAALEQGDDPNEVEAVRSGCPLPTSTRVTVATLRTGTSLLGAPSACSCGEASKR